MFFGNDVSVWVAPAFIKSNVVETSLPKNILLVNVWICLMVNLCVL